MTPPAAPGGWRARDAVLALGAGLLASMGGAAVVAPGGMTTLELFAVVLPLQSVGTLAAAVLMARRRGNPVDLLGLRWRWADLVGVAVGAGVQVAGAAVAAGILETFFDGEVPGQELVTAAGDSTGWVVRVLIVLGLVVLGPLAEEVAFRGILLPSLLRRGRRQAVVLSSGVFAAIHLVDPGAAFSVPFLFVLALILADERLRRGTLGRPIAIHAGFNLVTVVAVFAA